MVTKRVPNEVKQEQACKARMALIPLLLLAIGELKPTQANPAIWPQTRFHGDNTILVTLVVKRRLRQHLIMLRALA